MRFGSWIVAATMGVGLVAGAGVAQAAPAATLQDAVDVGPAPQVELVRAGCGFGEHRGWHGYCHYNRGWRGHVRYRHNHWRWHHWY